jgi:3-methylfumaryl-CoA hydratase
MWRLSWRLEGTTRRRAHGNAHGGRPRREIIQMDSLQVKPGIVALVTAAGARPGHGEGRDALLRAAVRDLRPAAPRPPRAVPAGADYAQAYTLDRIALFRYSALTFNGHRIHYDVDYCRTVEGYPDVVVHGPLIATLLLDLYARQGRPLTRFRYRATRPLFLPHAFTVSGKAAPGGASLWASNHEGALAMEAEAFR